MPIHLLAGGKIPASLAAKLAPAGGIYKLLAYLLLPALSLLMLLVAAVASVFETPRAARSPSPRVEHPPGHARSEWCAGGAITNGARRWSG